MGKAILLGFVFFIFLFGCSSQTFWPTAPSEKNSFKPLSAADCDAKGVEEKGFCLGEVALRNKNLLNCNTEDFGVTSDCVAFFAFETKNIDVCHNQSIDFDQGMCLGNYAEKTGNYDFCGKFDANDSKSLIMVNCHYYLADKVKDVKVCNNLKSGSPEYDYWARCIMEVATSRNEGALCDMIDDALVKDLCYISISQNSNDPDLCKKISDPEFKQSCQENFSTTPK